MDESHWDDFLGVIPSRHSALKAGISTILKRDQHTFYFRFQRFFMVQFALRNDLIPF